MVETLKIYFDFYDIDPNDSVSIIKFYESNALLLDNKSTFQSRDDFNNYVLVLGQYVNSLENLGKYAKSIKYADILLHLIDLKKDEFDLNIKDFTTYWSVLTSKGRAHYNLKQYKDSIQVFERLLTWDSDNDNFKNWLDSSKSRKRNSINKYLYIIAILIILIEIFFGNQFPNPKIKLYLSGIGFFLFFAGLINEYLMDKIIKMFNNK